MLLHVTAYFLFLVSMSYYYISLWDYEDITSKPQKFKVTLLITNGLSTLSMLMLAYVFWTIHKSSYTEDGLDESIVLSELTQSVVSQDSV